MATFVLVLDVSKERSFPILTVQETENMTFQ